MKQYNHVVIVVLENHSYSEIIGSQYAPFINNTLVSGGVLITNAYGEQHPSQPNYFWLFSGDNQGITEDTYYWLTQTPPQKPGPVFTKRNLYTALEEKFSATHPNFFGGYVDSGTDTPISDFYANTLNFANRHVPWLGFKNINSGNPAGITLDFNTQFPSGTNPDYSTLPIVSFIIPALNHDMHDFDSSGSKVTTPDESNVAVENSDAWLHANLNGYAEWAKDNNSLLIVTFDEDSTADWATPENWGGNGTTGGTNPYGMTAPNLGFNATSHTTGNKNSGSNQIAMIFYGANLVSPPGFFQIPGNGVNNVNLLRTIESFFDLQRSGAQSALATVAGLTDTAITEIFTFTKQL